MTTHILRPDRLRRLEAPFSWLPAKLLFCAAFEGLPVPAKLLYCFLCLVADRRGVSYWGRCRMATYLSLSCEDVMDATRALCHADLVAFDEHSYQVLSLPEAHEELVEPGDTPQPRVPPDDPPVIPPRRVREASPEQVKHHLRQILNQLGPRA